MPLLRRRRSITHAQKNHDAVRLERIIGTLLGLALAGAVLWVAPQGLWLALMLAALQFFICMLVVGNYALAVIFISALAITLAPADTRWKASPSSFGLAPSIQ